MRFVGGCGFRRRLVAVAVQMSLGVALVAGGIALGQNAPLPHLQKNGAAIQLMVEDKPYLMLAGELHNSSASDGAYMAPIWGRLAALHLNTVVSTVSWDLTEPTEGKFDFSLVDSQIKAARENGLHLVLIWFGTWKNTASSYASIWVKAHPERFPWRQQKDPASAQLGTTHTYSLSPFGKATLEADARAYRMLMRHLREMDGQHTVLMMQVENETGFLGESRDYSPMAEAVWNGPVPAELMRTLKKNKSTLLPELSEVWGRQGFRETGTWAEVFGDDANAHEIFMAWSIGSYTGEVAEAGKQELALPMYVNAWLVQNPGQLAGGYPSGGPVSRVMDVWRAAAPAIQFFAPDIYVNDFEGVCASYARSGNPLFLPELRNIPGNLMWAVARYAALGVSPFGIDDLTADDPLGELYKTLGSMMPLLLKAETTGDVAAVPPGTEGDEVVAFKQFSIKVRYGSGPPFPGPNPESQLRHRAVMESSGTEQAVAPAPPPAPVSGRMLKPITGGARGYAMIVAAGPDEYFVVGTGVSLTFADQKLGVRPMRIGSIEEGSFFDSGWKRGRVLNGDEGSVDSATLTLPPGPLSVRRVVMYR